MSRKRIPRRIRKQAWKRLGFRSPRAMRRCREAIRGVERILAGAFSPLVKSFLAMADGFRKMTNLDDVVARLGLARITDESDADLRARCRRRLALTRSEP